jgi:protein gp37
VSKTKIEWTEYSYNPIVGCTKCSIGCEQCYALRMAVRLAHNPKLPNETREKYASTVRKVGSKWEWSGQVALFPERLEQPLRWKKPRMVFVCSMSDWLHPDVPFSYAAKMLAVMSLARQHTFQLLTKRTDRLAPFFRWATGGDGTPLFTWPLPNVWLGVTAENQATADERVPLLLQCPAAVRFVSCEPLLRTVDLTEYMGANSYDWWSENGPIYPGQQALSWVIAGGESGPGARPMHPDWARSLRDQAQVAGVPFFFKQHGAWLHESQLAPANKELLQDAPPWANWHYEEARTHRWPDGSISYRVGKKAASHLLDGREWNEMPEVRE